MSNDGRSDSQNRLKRKPLACVRSEYIDITWPVRLKTAMATMILKKAIKSFFAHCSKCGLISTCISPKALMISPAMPMFEFKRNSSILVCSTLFLFFRLKKENKTIGFHVKTGGIALCSAASVHSI
ncbi:MAG: hypothetical protein IJV40_16860 [Oscillospiraceae bacterium]|nr:hypothetical protein [Oscillospiraceae bacterium]